MGVEPDPEDFAYGGVAGMLGERTGYNEGGSSIDKGKKGDSQVLPFDFDELDHDELMHIIKLLQAGEIPKLAQGGVAGLLGERPGYGGGYLVGGAKNLGKKYKGSTLEALLENPKIIGTEIGYDTLDTILRSIGLYADGGIARMLGE
jgi:hypothetical protein